MMSSKKEELATAIQNYKLINNLKEIQEELFVAVTCDDQPKDILIVVKDQLKYIQNCVESIKRNTNNYQLYIWDNGSKEETKDYLNSLDAHVFRSEENLGFIIPNNKLISYSTSPYVILLNSDTEVKTSWDKAMIGWLQKYPDVAQVGYCGSKLNQDLHGGEIGFGYDVDYISGWAFCIKRETYVKYGLFDEQNLKLAYCEDSDFSLRLKEDGNKIYALYSDLVIHYENRTISEIHKNEEMIKIFKEAFSSNHEYLKKRWLQFLQ